jgi:hypothetical protein
VAPPNPGTVPAAPDLGAVLTAQDSGATRTAPDSGATRTARDSGSTRTAPDSGSTLIAQDSGSTRTAQDSRAVLTAQDRRAHVPSGPPLPVEPTPPPRVDRPLVSRPTPETALRWCRWCAALLAVLALLGLELLLFGDRIESDLAALRTAGAPRSGPPASTAAPAPVPPPPAPPANGLVTIVDLRPLARCQPATTCETRLRVALRPEPTPRPVSWVFQVTDRCTGATQVVPGGSMVVGAGGTELVAVTPVPLPANRALVINAVLDTPARAASAALLAPADGTC